MKNLNYIFSLLLFSTIGIAQSPNLINYQALATDATGSVYSNHQMDIRISIVDAENNGMEVYREEHSVTSSEKGIFSLIIGNGNNQTGSLNGFQWGNGPWWLQVEADFDNTGYKVMGTNQLVSVPYAIHAETVTNNDDADADPGNELQGLTIIESGNIVDLGITLGGTNVQFDKSDGDDDPSNELQSLSIVNDSLNLSKGNKIDISGHGGHWDKRQDDLFYNKGTINIESMNQFQQTNVSMWGVSTINNMDTSHLSSTALRFYPDNASKRIGMNYSSIGYEMFLDTLGSHDPLLYLGRNAFSFMTGAMGTYGNSLLSFDDDLGTVHAQSAMSAQGSEYSFDGSSSFMSAFGTSFSDSISYSYFNRQGLHIESGDTPGNVTPKWDLKPDSLFGFNSQYKTIGLRNHEETKSGLLELFEGTTGERLFYLGDVGFIPRSAVFAMYSSDELEILSGTGAFGWTEYFDNSGFTNISLGVDDLSDSRGRISVHNTLGDQVGFLSVDINNEGTLVLANETGNSDLKMTTNFISLSDNGNTSLWYIQKNDKWPNTSQMFFNGGNGNSNVYIGNDTKNDDPQVGEILVLDKDGDSNIRLSGDGEIQTKQLTMSRGNNQQVMLTSDLSDQAGILQLNGPNGLANVQIHYDPIFKNTGRIDVHDEQGVSQAGIFVDNGMGYIFADVKNFKMDHPEDSSKEIWYASLEGPEAGAYVRGSAKLIMGEAFVPFPDHFKQVANPETMTVILTPLEWDTYGLAVVKKDSQGIYVKELKGGSGNFEFDWEVKCVRKGFEDYEVLKEKVH